MRWKHREPAPLKRLDQWHLWFAWKPVDIGTHWVWLETVERRGEETGGYDSCWWEWEYRDPCDGNGQPLRRDNSR